MSLGCKNLKFDKVGQWVSLLANIGVLFGFVAVAYQLHLNTTSLEAASSHLTKELSTSAEVALMGDTGHAAYAKSIVNPSQMTHSEIVQLWAYFSIAHMAATQSFTDYQEGRTTERSWHIQRELFVSYFNYPLGLVWWESNEPVYGSDHHNDFFSSVQEKLGSVPENVTRNWFLEIYEKSRSLE